MGALGRKEVPPCDPKGVGEVVCHVARFLLLSRLVGEPE